MAIEAIISHGNVPFISGGPRLSKTGPGNLDSLSLDLTCAVEWEAQVVSMGYQEGRKIAGYHSMWVDVVDGDPDGLFAQVSVSCVGLANAGDKRKRWLSAGGQQISVGPIEKTVLVWNDLEQGEDAETGAEETPKRRIPKLNSEGDVQYISIGTPSGLAERWTVRDPILEVRDRYYTTVKPQTNVAGTAMAPTNPPTPPPWPWVGYNEPMRHRHPNGWVIDDRQVEELFTYGDQGLWAVEDLFGYYYPSTPD